MLGKGRGGSKFNPPHIDHALAKHPTEPYLGGMRYLPILLLLACGDNDEPTKPYLLEEQHEVTGTLTLTRTVSTYEGEFFFELTHDCNLDRVVQTRAQWLQATLPEYEWYTETAAAELRPGQAGEKWLRVENTPRYTVKLHVWDDIHPDDLPDTIEAPYTGMVVSQVWCNRS